MTGKPHRPTLKTRTTVFDVKALEFPTLTFKGFFEDLEKDAIAAVGELIGTTMFLLIALGARQAVTNVMGNYGQEDSSSPATVADQLITNFYVCAAFGLSLYACTTTLYRFTGAIYNPSISLSLLCAGSIKPCRFVLMSTAQMLGGIAANAILLGLTTGEMQVDLTLGSGISKTQGLFIEMFTTAVLALNVLMLGAEKHLLTPHAPLGFAFTLFAVMLYSIPYTGAGINPARAFGTSCIAGFQSYHWIYWLGPTLGSLLATFLYVVLKGIRYWEISQGQDATAPLQGDNGPQAAPDEEQGLERLAERQT